MLYLKNIFSLTDELKDKIRKEIKTISNSRHVPNKIIQIDEVPRTINGKKVEIAVTRIIHGESAKNKDALANLKSLEQFENIEELKNN